MLNNLGTKFTGMASSKHQAFWTINLWIVIEIEISDPVMLSLFGWSDRTSTPCVSGIVRTVISTPVIFHMNGWMNIHVPHVSSCTNLLMFTGVSGFDWCRRLSGLWSHHFLLICLANRRNPRASQDLNEIVKYRKYNHIIYRIQTSCNVQNKMWWDSSETSKFIWKVNPDPCPGVFSSIPLQQDLGILLPRLGCWAEDRVDWTRGTQSEQNYYQVKWDFHFFR